MRNRTENESDQSRRFKNALLQEIQGSDSMTEVVTICATNKPAEIDKSFLRFVPLLYVQCFNQVQSFYVKYYTHILQEIQQDFRHWPTELIGKD